MTSSPSAKKWLVKTQSGLILGPYLFQDVQYRLLKKELHPNDCGILPDDFWRPLKNFAEFRETIKKLAPHHIEDATQAIAPPAPASVVANLKRVEIPSSDVLKKYTGVFVGLGVFIVLVGAWQVMTYLKKPKPQISEVSISLNVKLIEKAEAYEFIGQFEKSKSI